ncbi:lipocalin-like domain-containing protein [Methylobacterium sp. ID0610]|uniref:lipocalin-like domain-containing protein n=1 Tax=Methylobacterium carpenticola TaxID=3344827 RepID=UPI0036B9E9F1
MLRIAALLLAGVIANPALALDKEDIIGTWRLVSSTRKIIDTGEEINTYGERPTGWINYDRSGRMMALIVNEGRPRPESIEKMTDAERIRLFKSVLAYSGTYSFDGKSVDHKIDTSWNEVWTGTTQIRDVERQGDRLIYKTRPAPFSGDGRMSVVTLIWQKVQ